MLTKCKIICVGFWMAMSFSTLNAAEKVEVVVCGNGSGDYSTVQSAIDAQRAFSPRPITIHLKPGVYREKVAIPVWMTGITLKGEDAATTVITWDDFSGKRDGMHTFNSFTILIAGNDFTAENITFENSAGSVGQAVAVHVEGDRAVFRKCRFLGHQDTVYTGRENSRQFFDNCYIEGTTDFIFGGSTAFFRNCTLHSLRNSYITAASTPANIEFGYVFVDCRLTAADEVDRVYLGRPWRDYAKTVFINCEMGAHIRDEGWHNWNRPAVEQLVFYAEYGSFGPGANCLKRVDWARRLNSSEASAYSIANVLGGFDNWDATRTDGNYGASLY